jgi:pantetheine-phosphate adenylyltransferase
MNTIAIYPGSFDPITFGHIDIINRASNIFDTVIIAITQNQKKSAFLDITTRIELAKQSIDANNVEIVSFDNLLVDFAWQHNASVILRGIRAVSDFEYEFALASMNKQLNREIETMFMIPQEKYANISSTLVREISSLGGKIDDFVPKVVADYLKNTTTS